MAACEAITEMPRQSQSPSHSLASDSDQSQTPKGTQDTSHQQLEQTAPVEDRMSPTPQSRELSQKADEKEGEEQGEEATGTQPAEAEEDIQSMDFMAWYREAEKVQKLVEEEGWVDEKDLWRADLDPEVVLRLMQVPVSPGEQQASHVNDSDSS